MKIQKYRFITYKIIFASITLCTILTLFCTNNNNPWLFFEFTTPCANVVAFLIQKSIFHFTILKQNIKPMSECSEKEEDMNIINKKVVSFSLFFKDHNINQVLYNYVPGILLNLKKIRIIYPDWIMRIYTDLPMDTNETSFLKALQNETDLFICNVTNLPRIGNVTTMHEMVWRFLPIGDPTVSMFIVRDLDSVVSHREQSAVAEWENSNKTFHTMRDSPYHISSVMGGLWGAKNFLISRSLRLKLKNQFIYVGRMYFLHRQRNDQDLLHILLYKPYKHLFMIHDSYNCLKYKDSVPFPQEREHPIMFVGMKTYEFGNYDPFRCDVACRPSYGKNWTFC